MTSILRHGEIGQHHSDISGHGELTHHGEFDPGQAAMLQDLARNGAPESQIYGYPDAGANGVHLNGYGDGASNGMHSNGVAPVSGFAYHADSTYSQEDLDLADPAALLESLANFEHPSSSSNAQVSNDHFASLLQAAATAGGQEAAQVDTGRTTRQSRATEQLAFPQDRTPKSQSKRKLDKPHSEETHTPVRTGNKRRKRSDLTEDEEQLAREREIWGPDELEEDHSEAQYEYPPMGASDARAAGVHSAAALFRRPTAASKKYSRKELPNIFVSLLIYQ